MSLEPEVSQTETGAARKIPRWGIITGIIVAVLLIGAGLVYAFTMKSPKAMYFKAEAKTMEQSIDSLKEDYGDYWDLQQKITEDPYSNQLLVSADFEAGGMEAMIPGLQMIKEFLQDSQLEIVLDQDPQDKKTSLALAYLLQDVSVIGGDFFQSAEQSGIQVPALYDQYVYVQNDQFGELMKMDDPNYDGPEEIEYLFEQNSLEDMEKEFQEIVEDYGKFLATEIDGESVTLEDNVDFHGDEYRELTLSLSEEELKELLAGLLDKLENDEHMQDIFVREMTSSVPFALEELDTELNEENLREEYVDMVQEIRDGLDEVAFPNGFESKVVIDNNEIIVKRDVTVSFAEAGAENDSLTVSYASENRKDDDNADNIERTLELGAPNDETLTLDWNTKSAEQEEEKQIDTQIRLGFVDASGDEAVHAGFESTTKGTTADSETDFTLALGGTALEWQLGQDSFEIQGFVQQTTDQDLQEGYSKGQADLGFNFDLEGEEMAVSLAMESDLQFKDDLNFPDLSPDQAVNAVDATDEDWEEIMTDVESRLNDFMTENAELFEPYIESFMGAFMMGMDDMDMFGLEEMEEMEELPDEFAEEGEEWGEFPEEPGMEEIPDMEDLGELQKVLNFLGVHNQEDLEQFITELYIQDVAELEEILKQLEQDLLRDFDVQDLDELEQLLNEMGIEDLSEL